MAEVDHGQVGSQETASFPCSKQPDREPADVLLDAAALLEAPGAWTQGAFSRNANGESDCDQRWASEPVCYCAYGAIAAALNLPAPPGVHQTAAGRWLEVAIDWSNVVSWNDAPGRTQAEVVAALRRAAALATAKASQDLSPSRDVRAAGEDTTEPKTETGPV